MTEPLNSLKRRHSSLPREMLKSVDEKEMELALQLMWDAETFVTIPPELEHLTEAHWQYVETILTCLEIQRSLNRIH